MTVTIEQAKANLSELIDTLRQESEVVITRDDHPVAKLIATATTPRLARKPGSAKGKLIILKEDEEHLDDFSEYMP